MATKKAGKKKAAAKQETTDFPGPASDAPTEGGEVKQ